MGEIHELFVWALSLVWFAGATPDLGLGTFKQGVSKNGGNDICVATGIAIRCRRDATCRQCTGKRLSRTFWSALHKERMSHLCDSTVAGPTARRDNVLASKCEYPPFRYPPLNVLYLRCQNPGPFSGTK